MTADLRKQLRRAKKILLAEVESLDKQMVSLPAKHPKRDNRYQLRKRLQGIVALLDAEIDCAYPDPVFLQRVLQAGAAILLTIPVAESTMNIWDRLTADVGEPQVIIQGDVNVFEPNMVVSDPPSVTTVNPDTLTLQTDIPAPRVGGDTYVNE